MVVENRAVFNSVMNNVNGIAYNINKHNDELTNVITNFSEISDSLAAVEFAQTIKKADVALANIAELTERVNSGSGTIGKLMVNDFYNGLVETNTSN